MLGGRLLATGRRGLWSGGLRGAPRELSAQEPSGERTRAEAPAAARPRADAAQPVNARSDARKPGGRLEGAGEPWELRGERAGWARAEEKTGPRVGLLRSKCQGHSTEPGSGPERGSANPPPQRQRGVGGLGGPVSMAPLPCPGA